MSQITFSLPFGNNLIIEDNGPHGRPDDFFHGSTDRVLINGQVFYQPGQTARPDHSAFTYFLHVLNIDSLPQITSLQRAARIFTLREQARREAVAGHCDRSDELVRSANTIALGNLTDAGDDMPLLSYYDLYSLNLFLPDTRPDGTMTPLLNSSQAYVCSRRPRTETIIEFHRVTPSLDIRRPLEALPRRHRP